MSFIKRILLSIFRNPGKNFTLLGLVFIFGILLSASISTHHAIVQLEASLRLQLPPIAILEWDWLAFRRERELDDNTHLFEFPTIEVIEAVGSLPYVQTYDVIGDKYLYSRGLEWVVPPVDMDLVPEGLSEDELMSRRTGGLGNMGYLAHLPIRGVNNPIPIDIQAELISLSTGRFISQSEIDEGAHVAVVSSLFAETNNLYVGAIFTLENNIYDTMKILETATPYQGFLIDSLYWHLDEMKLMQQLIELEIVGIFDVEQDFLHIEDFDRTDAMTWYEAPLHNTIYLPYRLVENIARYALPYYLALLESLPEENLNELPNLDLSDERPMNIHGLFLLDNQRDFHAFASAAGEVLPDHWDVADVSSGTFGLIVGSMDTVLDVAQQLFWGAIGATIMILSLLIMLFLRDRRQEIGIYLALGEAKGKIMTQILLEVLVVAVFGMTLALFTGHHISGIISSQMLEQELIRQEELNPHAHLFENVPWELRFFNPGRMSAEDMMAAYDVSLDVANTTLFFSVQTVTIVLSTTIASTYIFRLKPKEILTFSQGS